MIIHFDHAKTQWRRIWLRNLCFAE